LALVIREGEVAKKQDKYNEDKFEEEDQKSFHRYYVPQIENAITSAQSAVKHGDNDWAHKCLDSADKALDDARKQTEQAIEKRDRKA
jgi:hypothetical protein